MLVRFSKWDDCPPQFITWLCAESPVFWKTATGSLIYSWALTSRCVIQTIDPLLLLSSASVRTHVTSCLDALKMCKFIAGADSKLTTDNFETA